MMLEKNDWRDMDIVAMRIEKVGLASLRFSLTERFCLIGAGSDDKNLSRSQKNKNILSGSL